MSENRSGAAGLHESGELRERARAALDALRHCELCPRACGVDRVTGELGFCQVGRMAQVASANLHYGEESPLVGTGGSGTIFMAGCNLSCRFCQNYDISHCTSSTMEVSAKELAAIMIALERRGAHNINIVSPSHVVAQVLEAMPIAVEHGLTVPLVYNTGGYDALDALELLDGVVDIYMPDVKFDDGVLSEKYCQAEDYPERAREAVREMHRQVGDLELDARGVAIRGLLVRHLVLPGGAAGTEAWMGFLAEDVSKNTYVNIMGQYHPAGEVFRERHLHPELGRYPTPADMRDALDAAAAAGITRLDER